MQQSLLLRNIGLLSSNEFASLGHFVRSPFFNNGNRTKQVEKLYDYIAVYFPELEAEALQKEIACHSLFSGKPVIELQKVMSELYKVLEKWMAWHQKIEQGGHGMQVSLAALSFINDRNQQDNTKLVGKALQDIAENAVIKDSNYYYEKYQLENELYKTQALFNPKNSDINLGKTIRALDVYYLVARLEYACSMKVQSWFTQIDTQSSLQLLRTIVAETHDDDYADAPILGILRDAFELLSDDEKSPNAFQTLRRKIEVSGHSIPRYLLLQLNAYLRNYCTRQYNQGELAYLVVLFELLKQHLLDETLYENGKLNPGTVQNIVNVGLKLREAAWVKSFLERHRHRIGGTDAPDEVYFFNLANYYFSTQQYQLAIDTLPQQYTDSQYEQAVRRLEIKAYFELQSPLFQPKFDAFKMFIHREQHRHNITAHIFELNNNFLKIVGKLEQSALYGNQSVSQKLLDKLHSLGAVAEREWLLQKISVGLGAGK